MSDFAGLYNIRDVTESDYNFIRATFIKGLYYGDSWFSLIPKQIYIDNYKVVIETLLAKGIISVACLKDDPSVIIGYSILSQDLLTIHWVYVKDKWRKNGIAKSLVPKYPKYVSHLTDLGKKLITKFDSCQFNPFNI